MWRKRCNIVLRKIIRVWSPLLCALNIKTGKTLGGQCVGQLIMDTYGEASVVRLPVAKSMLKEHWKSPQQVTIMCGWSARPALVKAY